MLSRIIGVAEPDLDLRDTENVPLPQDIALPIRDEDLVKLVEPCEADIKKVETEKPDNLIGGPL